ncbi:transposase family protein [Streptomyces sp. NBC_01314]|uniref:transposase family protein n=1 Tax=Streptomyces sp. NBC_01314 TaxID=2903821 RepID=UPI00308C735F|nr:transposase [Streptomyces sp. NBC_01314]
MSQFRARALAAAAAAASLSLLLAACGGGDSESDSATEATKGKVTLEFWSWTDGIEAQTKVWNKEHPDTQVKFVNPAGETAYQKLRAAVNAGTAPCLSIARSGGIVVLLDGTIVRTRRRTGADNRKNFSGKHKAHGLLFLALTDEKGNLIRISAAKPGRSSEITAARHNKITGHLREAGLGALADLGFVGLDDDPDDPVIITGRKATRNHRLTDSEKEANRLLNRERAAVEHGFANLKSWRFLTKVRMNARHATTLLRALLVLANTEVHR